MTDDNKRNFRNRVLSPDDVDVKAYAPVDVGYGKRLIIFSRDQIDYLMAGDTDDTSGIRLVNGTLISVNLALDVLHSKLHTPDFRNDNVVDLSAETKGAQDDLQLVTGNAKIGAVAADGSLFAGLSPETNTLLFVMPHSAGVRKTFNEASEYTAELCRARALGHDDWRLPTREELAYIFAIKKDGPLSEAFNTSASVWYWSSSPDVESKVWQKRFDSGGEGSYTSTDSVSVCCVRTLKREF